MICRKITVTTALTLVQADDGVTTERVRYVRMTTPANTLNVYWGTAGFTRNGAGQGGIIPPSTSLVIEAVGSPFMLEELWFDTDTNGSVVYLTAA